MPSCRWRMPNRRQTCGSESRPCDRMTSAISPEEFLAELGSRAGIVEERIEGEEFHSPSVQLRASPLKDVEVLSTHDQILGGATGQEFLGCRFPAHTGLRVVDRRSGRADRIAAGPTWRHRSIRRRLCGGSPERRVAPLRHRSQSAERWHDPPDAHTGSAHRRRIRSALRAASG